MRVTKNDKNQTVITVVGKGRFGPALEQRLRRQAKELAHREGFSRIRKTNTVKSPGSTRLDYIAYRPRSLDQAPEED